MGRNACNYTGYLFYSNCAALTVLRPLVALNCRLVKKERERELTITLHRMIGLSVRPLMSDDAFAVFSRFCEEAGQF